MDTSACPKKDVFGFSHLFQVTIRINLETGTWHNHQNSASISIISHLTKKLSIITLSIQFMTIMVTDRSVSQKCDHILIEE